MFVASVLANARASADRTTIAAHTNTRVYLDAQTLDLINAGIVGLAGASLAVCTVCAAGAAASRLADTRLARSLRTRANL